MSEAVVKVIDEPAPVYLARPIDPFLYNRLSGGHIRAKVQLNDNGDLGVVDDRGRFHAFARACDVLPPVDSEGAFGWDDRFGILFLSDAELARREEVRKATAIAREIAAAERTEQIRRDHPIMIPEGDDVLDALQSVRYRRYAIYRRAFGTGSVEGTMEPIAEVGVVMSAYIESVRLALPFPTEVWYAVNPFNHSGDGANHIAPTDALKKGRLERMPGEPLCKRNRGRRNGFFELSRVNDNATCVNCARTAEKMISEDTKRQIRDAIARDAAARAAVRIAPEVPSALTDTEKDA